MTYFPLGDYNILPKKELHWSLWVVIMAIIIGTLLHVACQRLSTQGERRLLRRLLRHRFEGHSLFGPPLGVCGLLESPKCPKQRSVWALIWGWLWLKLGKAVRHLGFRKCKLVGLCSTEFGVEVRGCVGWVRMQTVLGGPEKCLLTTVQYDGCLKTTWTAPL